ncbi:probable Golgi SNAP receptor complex member 2 [Aedes albopictus]|uniref:Putative golgi snap receptor complex member n=1 Tax=Aedes albopictus TaxID=7160 RepID=A0A023ELX1_AEDAL|nr:LOW QUALITY PROTEIN: probable Golgi SNAP receptor complex member 2 [Aedes albopictus]XP_029731092.1 probable Golgi SNAP receptor complex member 2 [Aedes albopictus]
MEALYFQTNSLIQETQQCFQQLSSVRVDSVAVEADIQTKLATVNANCDRLDVLLYKVPVAQRQNAKMRVDQLKYDVRHLQAALKLYQDKKARKEMELAERESLLNKRFTSNSETSIDIDYSLQHHNSMQNAHRGVDEMLWTGSNILDGLRNQRETLKGAKKRILDVGNTLGLSNQTMKMIERRLVEDKYVMIGGMIVTLLIIVLVIYFFVF